MKEAIKVIDDMIKELEVKRPKEYTIYNDYCEITDKIEWLSEVVEKLNDADKEKSKIVLRILNEGITFDCKDKQDVVEAILEEYRAHDICLGELLEGLEIDGLSVQDVVDIFAKVMHIVEADEVVQYLNGEHDKSSTRNRWDW